MTPLTSKQRRYLKGLAHHLKPAVLMGNNGLSEELLGKIAQELEHHELIKVRTPEGEAKALGARLAEESESHLCQVIGRVVVLYKRRRKDPEIRLPKV